MKEEFKIQESIAGKKQSKIQRYMRLIIGSDSYMDLLKYELIMLFFSRIPGALGVFCRSMFFPLLFKNIGKGVVFGANIAIRHPKKISIGNDVIIDDNVLLDAKGFDDSGITLEDEVFIGRNSILSCKGGSIYLGERTNIGFNCIIFSSNSVHIGKDNIVAAYAYIIGGGNYNLDRTDTTISRQPEFAGKGGVTTEDDVWLAAHAVLLDGSKIGKGSVVAAGAVVSGKIQDYTIVGGIPAKTIRERK